MKNTHETQGATERLPQGQVVERHRETVARLNTGAVWDAMTYDLGYTAAFVFDQEIRLRSGGSFFGPAFTVHGSHNPNRTRTRPEQAVVIRMLESIPPGSVEVLQPNHAGPVGSFGGVTMELVRRHGCIAAVTDGFTRDLDQLRTAGFPLACRGTTATNGFGSGWQLEGWGEPVDLRGLEGERVTVRPGDWIFADADATLVVPCELVEPMLDHAGRRLDDEGRLLRHLADGSATLEELERNIRERRFDF